MSKPNHFKNSFADPGEINPAGRLISEDMRSVVSSKLEDLVDLYRRTTADHGYDPQLAYRVLLLCLFNNHTQHFNLPQELHRFFKQCMSEGSLPLLQMCFDLLLVKQLNEAIPEQDIRLLKARLLKGLLGSYEGPDKRHDRRKCGATLLEYCKDSLKRQEVKRHDDIYSEILDLWLEQMKRRVSGLIERGKKVQAVEELGGFVQMLEKSDQVADQKYQNELMEAYWTLALLHKQLYYAAHTRKYAQMALHIATRIRKTQAKKLLTELVEADT